MGTMGMEAEAGRGGGAAVEGAVGVQRADAKGRVIQRRVEPAGPPAPLRQHVTASPPPEHSESGVPAHLEPQPRAAAVPSPVQTRGIVLLGLSNPPLRRAKSSR